MYCTRLAFYNMSFLFGSAVCLSIDNEISGTTYRHFSRRMSNSGLTSEAQLRYILQWFGEFSELQREDFLPILAAAHGDNPDQLASTLASLSCDDKPMSLFQCRIKLFNEWYPTWTEEERDRLFKAVSEMDSDFGTKLQDALINGIKVNGEVNGSDDIAADSPNLEGGVILNQLENVDESADNILVSQDSNHVEIAAAS